MVVNKRKILIFIGLTFGVCWLMAIAYMVMFEELKNVPGLIMTITYMFIPMTMAIIVQKVIYREPLREPLGISFKINRWFLVAWLLPPIIAIATFGISLLFPGVEYSSEMKGMVDRFGYMLTPEKLEQFENQIRNAKIHPIWLALLQGLVAGISVNAIAGFGEELGWRGLLQKEFGALGFWRSSWLIGFIWGIWHAPIILQGHNYPQHPIIGVFMMTIWCMLLAPIFSYVRLKAKSVIAAAIIHGSLNGTFGLSIMLIMGGNDLTVGSTGLAGFIVLVIVNLGILVHKKGEKLWL